MEQRPMAAARDVIPSGESRCRLGFSGFVLDLDACTLVRDAGAPVALTRSELALLRFLAQRPGRVASRETLLDAMANRRFAPFDRSVDVVVGRLRRKIECDPKRPRIIVTVPGEGYRFDGQVSPCALASIDDAETEAVPADEPQAAPDVPYRHVGSGRPGARSVSLLLGMSFLLVILAFAGFLRPQLKSAPMPPAPPSVVVLPFANL